jgi:hypothetical protein
MLGIRYLYSEERPPPDDSEGGRPFLRIYF